MPFPKKINVVSKGFPWFSPNSVAYFVLASFHRMMVARYFEVFPCGEVPGEVLQGTQRCLDDECDHESQQESRNRSEPYNNLKWINLVSAWVAVGFEYLLDAVGEANLMRTTWIMH